MKKLVALAAAAVIFSGCREIKDETAVHDTAQPAYTYEENASGAEEDTSSGGVTETLIGTETVSQTEIFAYPVPAEPVGGDIEESDIPEVTEQVTQVSSETEELPEETADTVSDESGITYIDGILIVNKTYPLPADYAPGVNSEAQEAFDKMQADAADLGLTIYISSGFRSYDYQAGLYKRYVERDGKEAADRYSARPGYSEHQSGLAFDLNTITDDFKDTDEGRWVAENCYKYGFIIRYPADKEDVTGYMYEPWHIRYLGTEIAEDVYSSGLCLEEYLGITSEYAE